MTHTICGGPRFLFFSRTAGTLSTGGRGRVVRRLRRFCGKGAIIMITRELDAIGSTSGVIMLSGKYVIRRNARQRLARQGKLCCQLIGGRLRLNDW